MVFKVQVVKNNKPVTNVKVVCYCWRKDCVFPTTHIGNGWYECSAKREEMEIIVDDILYGEYRQNSIVDIT